MRAVQHLHLDQPSHHVLQPLRLGYRAGAAAQPGTATPGLSISSCNGSSTWQAVAAAAAAAIGAQQHHQQQQHQQDRRPAVSLAAAGTAFPPLLRHQQQQRMLSSVSAPLAFAGLAAVAWLCLQWLLRPVVLARSRSRCLHTTETSFLVPAAGAGGVEGSAPFEDSAAPPAKVLSVVVPAYNESQRIRGMLDVTLAYLQEAAAKDAAFTYEVVVVDDGSNDGTGQVALEYCRRLGTDKIRLCTLRQNCGKGAAVREGMLRMRGQYALMADADAAADISDLGRLLETIKRAEVGGWGVAIGSRAHIEAESIATRAWYRTIMMHVFHWCVLLLCTRRVRDTQCGFKLFTRKTAQLLFSSLHLDRWAFDIELVYLCEHLGIPMEEVAVRWHEVPGSKLIVTKMDIVTTSLTMLRDMLCVKMCYTLGVWKSGPPPAPGQPATSNAVPLAAVNAAAAHSTPTKQD